MAAAVRDFLYQHAQRMFYADPVAYIYPAEVIDSITIAQLMAERESIRIRIQSASARTKDRLKRAKLYLTALIELKRSEYTAAAQVMSDVYTNAGRIADGVRLFTEYQAIRAGFKSNDAYA